MISYNILIPFAIGLYLCIGSQMVFQLYKLLNVDNRCKRDVPMVQFSKAPCGASYDRICISNIKAYCCIFLTGPSRFLQLLCTFATGMVYTLLVQKIFGKERVEETTSKDGKKTRNVSFDQEQSTIYWIAIRTMHAIFAKIFLFGTGARVTEKKLKISDFFADYGKYEEKNKNFRAPIMISNHVTVFDFALHTRSYKNYLVCWHLVF